MSRDIDVHDHYLNGGIPPEIAENFKTFFPDHEDLSYEEFLLQQGSVYLSFQEKGKQSINLSQASGRQEGEYSRGRSTNSQEALDEALALSLLELEEDFYDFEVTERSSITEVRENSVEAPARATSQNARQDGINPDNMNYEELIELGETVGVEKKGISEDRLDRLPTFKYKTGFFSKKKNKKDCVICQMEYSSGDRLTTLPCQHQYHSKCIRTWLKVSKDCPVCKKEVQVD